MASLLGHAVRFESDSTIALDRVRELVQEYRGHVITADIAHPLCVRVTASSRTAWPSAGGIRHVSHADGRLTIEGTGVTGTVDPVRREGVAEVDRDLLDNPDEFRAAVLEPLTLALISHFDRHPVHAAAIVHKGKALLLAGPGGAGKSTLAYAALRAGYHVLTDDVARIQLEPTVRVWGGPARVRLRTQGPTKDVHRLDGDGPAFADAVSVCILGRGGEARLDHLDGAAVRRHLDHQLAPGFDRFPDRHSAVMGALTDKGGFHLTLTGNPNDALPLIANMLECAT